MTTAGFCKKKTFCGLSRFCCRLASSFFGSPFPSWAASTLRRRITLRERDVFQSSRESEQQGKKKKKKKSRSRVWCQSVGYRCGWARRPPSVGSTLVTVSSRTAKIERPSISSGLTLEEEELGVYIYIYTYSGWIHAAAAQCIAGKKNRIIHSDVFWQQIRRRSQPALLSSSSSFWERDEFAAMEKM